MKLFFDKFLFWVSKLGNVRYFPDLMLYGKANKYISTAYSQEGEDLILLRIFESNKPGFYIDVGAHHPQRFSNTYMLYQKGWRGINIDANSAGIKAFEKARPRDINLTAGISEKAGESMFYFFDEPALNTFDKKIAQDLIENTDYKLVKKQKIKIVPLSIILDKHISKQNQIDILSVDVEGNNFEVLKSNNWAKYKPSYILVECRSDDEKGGLSFKECTKNETILFLDSKGYELFAKTVNTLFFRLKNFDKKKK